jgi:hypothetical protein
MFKTQQYIQDKQTDFKAHPFFTHLREQTNFEMGMSFVPKLAFWVMAFQDLLSLIPPRIKTKELRRIATHHKMEDSGHDIWFFQDALQLNKDYIFNTRWIFGPEQKLTRELTYNIASKVFQGSDHQKVLFILVLESTGHVFFANVAQFAKQHGQDSQLKYFSSHHLTVEQNHEIFEEQLLQAINKIILSDEERNQAIEMIDDVYQSFNLLFSHLQESFMPITTKEADDTQRLVA